MEVGSVLSYSVARITGSVLSYSVARITGHVPTFGKTPKQAINKNTAMFASQSRGLSQVRDLVVDMSNFYAQYKSIKPYLVKEQAPKSSGCVHDEVTDQKVVKAHLRTD